MMKIYIKRESYIKKIKPFIDKGIVKVLIGQRRVGKSFVLFQIIDEIKKINKKANIIYINKESNEFEFINDYKDLLEYIKEKQDKKNKNYLFIDEIQDINKFELAIRDLVLKDNFDIYITGSNSNIFSSELATFLSGRYIEIEIKSLSFNEFLKFHNLKKNKESLFKYMKFGGMPYLVNLELTEDIVYEYLKNIYNTIILKDVVFRNDIRNAEFLNRLIEFLSDNIGNLISANKINDFLKSQKVEISINTILNYINFLNQTFFIQKVKRQNIIGKKIFEINEKYYFEDLGIKNSIFGYKESDINKILENLVYSHLKNLGYNVFVGVIENKEIDFVAFKNDKKIYVQVCYLLFNKETKDREFGNLLSIKDNYEKIVVSMDQISNNYMGIKNINILDFLTDWE